MTMTPKRWAILEAINDAGSFAISWQEIGERYAPEHIKSRRQWAHDAMYSLVHEHGFVSEAHRYGWLLVGLTSAAMGALDARMADGAASASQTPADAPQPTQAVTAPGRYPERLTTAEDRG